MPIGKIFKGIAGAGLIVAGAVTGNVGLVVAGGSIIASTLISTSTRQNRATFESAGTTNSMRIPYGRTSTPDLP